MDNKKDLVILVYMTLECNLRCYYCVVNFKKEFISFNCINDILKFISKNRDKFGNISVEFFGGEPLLVFDKIKYFVEKSINLNLKYKITTNGTLINREITEYFNQYFSSVYISFSNLSKTDLKNIIRIYSYIGNKNIYKYAITFIYHPKNCFKEHIKYLNTIISIGYKNINILPIYMYHEYNLDDFDNLKIFLEYTNKVKDINFDYFYFIENKKDIEFSIVPDGTCSLDSGETIYDMKGTNSKKVFIGNIKKINYLDIEKSILNFNLKFYIKDFLSGNFVKQSYNNFMKLSDLLYKYK